MLGKVKSFNSDKGFGYIEVQGAEDVFVHHSALEMDGDKVLEPGQKVQFELEQGPKGPTAKTVTLVKSKGSLPGRLLRSLKKS